MSDAAQEADVHADGSTAFDETPPVENDGSFPGEDSEPDALPNMEEQKFVIDPAIFLLLGVAILIGLYYFFVIKKKKNRDDEDVFFADLDGKKFDINLPSEVEEYYKIRAKCEGMGWTPGASDPADESESNNANGAGRILAQALMKRAMADIPMVQHIQKESQGMGKLYAKSMCSVNQWRAFQAAEALVSAEVEQVRAEADELDPGWSDVIWKQAVQYHAMLKQKHEAEAKQQQEKVAKVKSAVAAAAPGSKAEVAKPRSKEDEAKAKERAAQRAAEELIKEEEREKNAKKAFASGGGVKKGFLDGKGKKK